MITITIESNGGQKIIISISDNVFSCIYIWNMVSDILKVLIFEFTNVWYYLQWSAVYM